MSTLISIGIPTYNQASFLRQAILSVLRQSWQEFEVIVVDDCSTDGTPDVVREFKDPRIRYHRTARNLRPPKSWNVCAKLVRGDYFAVLPHDDVYLPGFLETMAGALQRNPEVGFAQCAFYVVDAELRPKGYRQASEVPLCLSGEDALIWQMERLLCQPCSSDVSYRKGASTRILAGRLLG